LGKRASGAEQPHKLPADIASWYLDALESAPFGVLIHDGSGRVIYYNRFLEKLTGYSRTEIPDIRTWIEKVYPDPSYRKVVNAERAAQWPAEELRIRESIITIKDGTKRPCLFLSNTSASGVHTVTIQPAEGEWEALAGAIAGYENFQSQFYSTPTPLMAWIRQKEGFVLAAYNKAVETITSGQIRGSVGKSARELLNAPAAVLDCMRKCYDDKNSVECPERFELPGVDTGYDYDRTFLFMPPKYVVMHISTASEFERTRKSLRESERRYRELVDMLPITIFEVDTDGNYTFLNRQGLKLLGCGPDELKHIKSLEMIVEADRDRARESERRKAEKDL
jgi:PAS domain S-box-containing protein